MCHEIRQEEGTIFLDGHDCIYGVKEFLYYHTAGILRGYVTKYVYDLEARGERIHIPINCSKQDLTLALVKVYGENATTVLKKHREAITAGYHISPLCCSPVNKAKVYVKASTHFYSISVRMIVGFLDEDILFFDGKDVSVEKFFLPSPRELAEKFYFYKSMEEWYLPQYERLYEEVMEKCASNKQGSNLASLLNGSQEDGGL